VYRLQLTPKRVPQTCLGTSVPSSAHTETRTSDMSGYKCTVFSSHRNTYLRHVWVRVYSLQLTPKHVPQTRLGMSVPSSAHTETRTSDMSGYECTVFSSHQNTLEMHP